MFVGEITFSLILFLQYLPRQAINTTLLLERKTTLHLMVCLIMASFEAQL